MIVRKGESFVLLFESVELGLELSDFLGAGSRELRSSGKTAGSVSR